MKKTLMLFGVCAAIALSTGAAEIKYGYVSRTAAGATNAEAILHAGDGALRVTSMDVTADSPETGVLRVYSGTDSQAAVAVSASTATNIVVAGNTLFKSNDVVVVQKADDTVFSATVWGTNGTTNIYFTAQLGTEVGVGDMVYRMGAIRTNVIGAATVRLGGECLYAGKLRMPMRLLLTGTNTAVRINNVTARYEPAAEAVVVAGSQ